jgi:hypothetical protein
VVCRFFLPFPVLLFQFIKKNKIILWVSWWILAMQILDMYVIVLPAFHRDGFDPSILDLFSFVGIGGVLGWFFLTQVIGKSYLFPTRDPRLLLSLKLSN